MHCTTSRRETHEDCGMIYDRLPSPKQMQTLVQVWKQGRKSTSYTLGRAVSPLASASWIRVMVLLPIAQRRDGYGRFSISVAIWAGGAIGAVKCRPGRCVLL